MRFENSLLSVGNCPSIYFLIQIASTMRRASSSQPANAATDLNPGLKFPFFFLLSIGKNGEKEDRNKKRGAGRKDHYRKTTGHGKLCCILLSFNFQLPLWNKTCFFQISFIFCRSASVFRSASDQLQSSDQLQLLQNFKLRYVEKRKIPNTANEVEALGIIREGSRARVWIEE